MESDVLAMRWDEVLVSLDRVRHGIGMEGCSLIMGGLDIWREYSPVPESVEMPSRDESCRGSRWAEARRGPTPKLGKPQGFTYRPAGAAFVGT
jgi:hypothetical protein